MTKGKRKLTPTATIACPKCLQTLTISRADIKKMAEIVGLTISDNSPSGSSTPTKKRDRLKETLQWKAALYRRQMIANGRQV